MFVAYRFLPAQPFSMARVASVPDVWSWVFACSDANHNSCNELYCTRTPLSDTLIIIEFRGNTWERINTTTRVGSVWSTAEDYDGFGEILCGGSQCVKILKSPDSLSFPLDSVWGANYPSVGGPFFPEIVALDTFPDQELAVRVDGSGVVVYKNMGNGRYNSIADLLSRPTLRPYQYTTGDFDMDGLPELVYGDLRANLFVFEWTGIGHEYVLSAVCSTETVDDQTFASSAKMDKDGCPEFITVGTYDSLTREKVMVYGATGPGHYERLWEQDVPLAGLSPACVATGDVDGDGMDEFAVSSGGQVFLFKNVALHTWQQVAMLDSVGGWFINLFDINRDGRAELLYDIGDEPSHIVVYEDTAGLSSITEFNQPPRPSRVGVQPTIAALGTPMTFSGLTPASEVEVYSITGQLVRRQPIANQTTWLWDLRDNQGRALPAGTYFSTVRSKGTSTQLKLCIVR